MDHIAHCQCSASLSGKLAMPGISQVLGEKTEKRRRKKLRSALQSLPGGLLLTGKAKTTKRGTAKVTSLEAGDGVTLAWLTALTAVLQHLAVHDASEVVPGGQALTLHELVADLSHAGAVDVMGQLLESDSAAVASSATEILTHMFHIRENPVNFAATSQLAILAQLLHSEPLVVQLQTASALSVAVAVAWDAPAFTLSPLLQDLSNSPPKKRVPDNSTVLSPRIAGSFKRGKKGFANIVTAKTWVTETGTRQEGVSLIGGLLKLAETSAWTVQQELAGVDAPGVLALMRRHFGAVMEGHPSEAEAAQACSPLLAQLARSVALSCMAHILGASCQDRSAKAELLSLYGATLVPVLLRAASSRGSECGVEVEERRPTPATIDGGMKAARAKESALPAVAPLPESGCHMAPDEAGSVNGNKKSPRSFSLSSLACGFLPNLLSVPGAAKVVPSSPTSPRRLKASDSDLQSEFELVDNHGSDSTNHPDVHTPVDIVQDGQPVVIVSVTDSSPLPLKLPESATRCTVRTAQSPVKEAELPEAVTAAARCLAFLGYRPFPLWQAAEAPREDGKDREVDDFVVVELEEETKEVWDQMHGEVPNALAPAGALLEGAMLPLADAALAAIAKVRELYSCAGDPPLEEMERASMQAALLVDCCANLTHDLAVAEKLAAEGPVVRQLTSLVETIHGLSTSPPSKTGPPSLHSSLCEKDRLEAFHMCTAQKATSKASSAKRVQPVEALEALGVPAGPDAVLPMPPASRKPGMTFGYSTEIAHHAPPVYASLLILIANLALASTASILPECFGSAVAAQVDATKVRGNEALNRGDHEYARWCYNLALRLAHSAPSQDAKPYPQRHILWSNRAEACLRAKRYMEALHDVDQALVIDPAHLKSILRRERAVKALSEGELGKENTGVVAALEN